MKAIIWILVELWKTFLWVGIFCLSVAGFFIFLDLSLFFQIVVGIVLFLAGCAYAGDVLKKLGL